MLNKKYYILFYFVLQLVGCCCEKMEKERALTDIQFEVDDRRELELGGICAVSFAAVSRFQNVPNDVYIGPLCGDVISEVYAEWEFGEWDLGPWRYVEQATTEFSHLEVLCREAKLQDDSNAVSATFYWENAYPRTYLIDQEAYRKIVGSWAEQNPSLRGPDVLPPKRNRRTALRMVDWAHFVDILRSKEYELVVAFPDEDGSVADVCGNNVLPYAAGFFRLIGDFFPISDDGVTRYVEHIQEHLVRRRAQTRVRVVIW